MNLETVERFLKMYLLGAIIVDTTFLLEIPVFKKVRKAIFVSDPQANNGFHVLSYCRLFIVSSHSNLPLQSSWLNDRKQIYCEMSSDTK